MLNLYYRIWVSILLRVKSTQNNFFSLIQALLVITGANLINYIFICIFFITVFKINIDFLYRFYSINRYLTDIFVVIIFLFPNYFLLIHNGKYLKLIEKFKHEQNKNIGINYFILSFVVLMVFIILLFVFPDFFGLKTYSNG
jgi:hypothetical protein